MDSVVDNASGEGIRAAIKKHEEIDKRNEHKHERGLSRLDSTHVTRGGRGSK